MKMMLLILMSLLASAGCTALGGDLIIRVSGSVPASELTGKVSKLCQLTMVSTETGKQSSTKGISVDFSTTMMVVAGPEPKRYYFVAECDDGREFRSDKVTISSRGSYSREFNLGTLVENKPSP